MASSSAARSGSSRVRVDRRDPLAASARRIPARSASRSCSADPTLDVHWEHHPAHFWLVLVTALVNVGLGLPRRERRRGGSTTPRLFLVSLGVRRRSAGFLALHALATPGVLLEKQNAGFVDRHARSGSRSQALFAAASALDLSPERVGGGHAAPVAAARGRLRARWRAWGVYSLAEPAARSTGR